MATTRTDPAGSPRAFQLDANYLFTALLSWLIPGAGHWLLGYRVRAALIATAILGTFWIGEVALGGRMAVTWEVHPVFYCLQAGSGLSAILADGLWGHARYPAEITEVIRTDLPRHLALGILFTSVSGLLNLLVIFHVLDPRTWRDAAKEHAARVPAGGGAP